MLATQTCFTTTEQEEKRFYNILTFLLFPVSCLIYIQTGKGIFLINLTTVHFVKSVKILKVFRSVFVYLLVTFYSRHSVII